MSTSRKYIYIITESSELLFMESSNLSPIKQAFSIHSEDSGSSIHFKENITRIWTDREGNHNIIRLGDKIYYFSPLLSEVIELNIFKGIEICAIGFDDNNKNYITTDSFLATDYNNNIYDCSISLFENMNGYSIKDQKQIVSTLYFEDWDYEDDDDDINDEIKNDRIYGIRFFKAEKKKEEEKKTEEEKEEEEEEEEKKEKEEEKGESINKIKGKNENNLYYIIATTKTKLYQIYGEGQNFKQVFYKYNKYNSSAYNDSCKYFPILYRRKRDFIPLDLKMLYKKITKLLNLDGKLKQVFVSAYIKSLVLFL